MPGCDGWSALIIRTADGTIGADESARLAAHLHGCERCRLEAESQAELTRLLATRPDEPVPAAFSAHLEAALDGATTRGRGRVRPAAARRRPACADRPRNSSRSVV